LLGTLGQPAEKDQHRFLQECVFFNQAATHGDEVLKCARELCEKYGFKQELENLEDVWKKTKPQGDNAQLLDQERAGKERAMKTSAEGSSAKGEGGISKKRKRSTDSSKHEVVVISDDDAT
jgi:ADP-heptose:LPS heptosyltransferase